TWRVAVCACTSSRSCFNVASALGLSCCACLRAAGIFCLCWSAEGSRMFRRRLLPWEYGVRNLLRRPARTVLTMAALTVVVLLVFVVVGFIRGLQQSLANSGDPRTVLVYAVSAEENIENSAIESQIPGVLSASLPQIE